MISDIIAFFHVQLALPYSFSYDDLYFLLSLVDYAKTQLAQ